MEILRENFRDGEGLSKGYWKESVKIGELQSWAQYGYKM